MHMHNKIAIGYIVIGYIAIGYIVIGYIVIGYIVIGYIAIGYIIIGYIAIGYIVIGYIAIGYIVIGYIFKYGNCLIVKFLASDLTVNVYDHVDGSKGRFPRPEFTGRVDGP